ncbi:GPI-anchored cell wall organization protein Ecm33 [Emericellopsis cladophorae]|uniref:GPI-anchored cell wall organization protein Ecm33 n=1 Tax=Emericellopsis cladophorae TaxID=2686198 RepID=A0A9P9Y6R3_9HYPO|nr:GPI-anchored cell wall organization protein Ecm33 [Emericellopsis cladophorae]KAI6784360.1 GPI-anchored cell wall organization protein Ecm33 [Emericellopsis cladophorae]
MRSTQFAAAVAAFAGLAVAKTCTKDIEISEPTPVIDCDVVDADITVNEDVSGALSIEGPKQLKGNLIINNASSILSISSSSINSIGGRLEFQELNSLNSIDMGSLESVSEIVMRKLTALQTITFGSDSVTEAESVEITDTDLSSLSGLMLTSVKDLNINNNDRLTKFDSALVNVTGQLLINSNGRDMEITLNDLESASEIQIGNVKTFEVPKLSVVKASLKFDQCDKLESFSAPNLTKITDALAFINNEQLSNVSFPKLTEIGGDLRIVNNTEFTDISGFPKLESAASINFGGNFEEIDMPELNRVSGTADVSTTSTEEDFCKFFEKADDDGVIRGGADCTFDNEDANQGGETEGGRKTDGSSSSGDDSGDNEDAAGIVGVNTALMGLALIAGVAQLL